MQLRQLFRIDFAGRVDHQILRGSSFRKGHHVANVLGWYQHHHRALYSRSNAAVRWRTVGERVEEETKARARRLLRHTERLEHNGLHIAAVNSDRAARNFDAV